MDDRYTGNTNRTLPIMDEMERWLVRAREAIEEAISKRYTWPHKKDRAKNRPTHGILHRDLKPANILLDDDGKPYVADFGIAKRVDQKSGVYTHSGAGEGAPSYMAPEQADGESKPPTRAVDVYSLGVILFEILTGKPPFEGATANEIIKPQPEYVRSAQHNLPSEERFARLVLDESNGRKMRCEYFPKYGEEGHSLAYCRGNDHLPDFIRDHWITPICQLVAEAGLVDPSRNLTWKLTANFYRNVGGTIAGFPFHVDIPANGVVTMILNIHREALFQITRGEVMTDIQLAVGSLLILSGESRYEWKHRILPMAASGPPASRAVERVSLVLGYQ